MVSVGGKMDCRKALKILAMNMPKVFETERDIDLTLALVYALNILGDEQAKTCKECGGECRFDAKYCQNCGNKLEETKK